ncbi:MAG: tRNA (adenosine(37)-N6)-dimethylallyltransferase MiaA [Deltaproteobacteria bacterium]
MQRPKAIVITGPTAVGKSNLSLELAELFNAEIISADSMQVYRHMDIGTAKPSKAVRASIKHHLIDVVNPDEGYTAARFASDAHAAMERISSLGKAVFIVGGTGLYIKALTQGLFAGPGQDFAVRERLLKEALDNGAGALFERLRDVDPQAAAAIHPNNLRRIIRGLEVFEVSGRPITDFQREHGFQDEPFDDLRIALHCERDALYEAIDRRVDKMMEHGLIYEARELNATGYAWDLKPMCGLGYKEMGEYLRSERGLDEAVELIKRNTRHYAKRQMTWFRKDASIKWFTIRQKEAIIECLKRHLG